MPDIWEQVKSILGQALELPMESRADFVEHACGGDVLLRREVESLLANSNAADSLLEHSPAITLWTNAAADPVGRRFGAYRILSEIGHGGMAVVYLAERDDQEYRKRAAIKMLRAVMPTDEIRQRFRNERQTLAELDHPNIVRLIDGGSTAEGLPYLVMDYVEGSPIGEYCQAKRLTVHERVELFAKICDAVQYAHDRQIIHRDLKPSNVLVTSEGVPRLLDFGIAKLLTPDNQATESVTQTGSRPMTPEYASPEQVRGENVGVSSDIYSLGVMLYELMAEQRPFQAEGNRTKLERQIRDEDPAPPSQVARKSCAGAIEGDLDAIILKALSKAPEQRYTSVREFADDLRRYLEGRPVRARRPGIAYQAGRFLRRHKEAAATAIIVIALAVSAGMWMARSRFEEPKRMAQISARRSIAVLGLKNLSGSDQAWLSTALSEMLAAEMGAGEQMRVLPDETVARVSADLGLRQLERVPDDMLPRVRANLNADVIVTGSYRQSATASGQQIVVDVRVQNAGTAETIASVSEEGPETRLVELAMRTGSLVRARLGLSAVSEIEDQQVRASFPSKPAAMRLYAEGLETLRAMDALGARDALLKAVADAPGYSLAHGALARAWGTLGYDQRARSEAKLALDTADPLSRENHLLTEARYYEALKKWPSAIDRYQALRSTFPDVPEYALSLASVQASAGQGQTALDTLARLSESNAIEKEDPRVDLGIALAAASMGDSRLRRDAAERAAVKADLQGAKLLAARARSLECRALANLGEIGRAQAVCEEARKTFADAGDRAGLARTLHAMAEIPLNQGRIDEAENLYRQALTLMRQTGYQQGIATELVNLALIAAHRGDFERAEATYGESFRVYEQTGDKNGMAVASGNLGNLFRAEGKLNAALESYRRSQGFSEASGNRAATAHALHNTGIVLAEEGMLFDAHKKYEEALAIQQQIGERGPYSETLVDSALAYLEEGDLATARRLLDQAAAIQRSLQDAGDLAETQLALSKLALDSGQPVDAERFARSALDQSEQQKEPAKVVEAKAKLTLALLAEGKASDARGLIEATERESHPVSNVTARGELALAHARVLLAVGALDQAERIAQAVFDESAGVNARLQFEFTLVLTEIGLKRHDPRYPSAIGGLASAAQAKGFNLIARKMLALGAASNAEASRHF